MNSDPQSPPAPSPAVTALVLGLILSVWIAFGDALFLGYLARASAGAAPLCAPGSGCSTVLSSAYSKIAGVPLAFLALAGQFLLAALLAAALAAPPLWSRRALGTLVLCSAGFTLISLHFGYVQAYVLKSFCAWCLALLVSASLEFGLAGTLWNHVKAGSPLRPAGGPVAFLAGAPLLLGLAVLGLLIRFDRPPPILRLGPHEFTQQDFERDTAGLSAPWRMRLGALKDRWADDKLVELQLHELARKQGRTTEALETEIRSTVKVPEKELGALQGAVRDQRRRELEAELLREARRQAASAGTLKLAVRKLWEREAPVQVSLDCSDVQSRGPADALVLVVLISDFECPFCKQAAGHLDKLEASFGAKIRIAMLHNPLPSHKSARLAAAAAECAGASSKFWEYRRLLLENADKLDLESLVGYAGRLGLDAATFRRELDSGRFQERVDAQRRRVTESGLHAVPVFLINGQVLQGAVAFDVLAARVQAALPADR